MKISNEVNSKQVLNTFTTLEKRCRKVHGDIYDYSEVVFKSMRDKVTIICREHGPFRQTMTKHINNANGCRKCAHESYSRSADNAGTFIERAITIHGNKYDYSEVEYINTKLKVDIICPTHGKFSQTPGNHLSGSGCLQCGYKLTSAMTKEQAIEKIKRNSPTPWIFTKFTYTNAHCRSVVICPTHGEHEVKVNNLFNGHGCPYCAVSSFRKDKPAILYYVEIDRGKFFKIGITNKDVKARFSRSEFERMKVLKVLQFSSGEACYKVEQALLTMYYKYRYAGPPILNSGNTELFTIDILPKLD